MTSQRFCLTSTSPDQTAQLAARLAPALGPSDVILMQGDVGAGKTHFARSLIQALLDVPEDIPSPTFTLVQTYPTSDCDVWHADLYRLTSVQEIEELGLVDAFETDICLIEWPDRLGALAPDHALTLAIGPGASDDARLISVGWRDPKWATKMKVWKD